MAKNASGYHLTSNDIPVVLGMRNRKDRDHDIAAWFGVNQGRVAEAKDGKWGNPKPAPTETLPPKGPPGIKGRRLKSAVDKAIGLANQDPTKFTQAIAVLEDAVAKYDANEA
jgi:hypothetical protein